MGMEIQKTAGNGPIQEYAQKLTAQKRTTRGKKPDRDVQLQEQQPQKTQVSQEKLERYLKEILNMSDTFNRRLKFSINHELNEIVVKVINRETDKVIKEIPPAALQRLHVKMKEFLGLLFDEQI